jgi:hypothetical protein
MVGNVLRERWVPLLHYINWLKMCQVPVVATGVVEIGLRKHDVHFQILINIYFYIFQISASMDHNDCC